MHDLVHGIFLHYCWDDMDSPMVVRNHFDVHNERVLVVADKLVDFQIYSDIVAIFGRLLGKVDYCREDHGENRNL